MYCKKEINAIDSIFTNYPITSTKQTLFKTSNNIIYGIFTAGLSYLSHSREKNTYLKQWEHNKTNKSVGKLQLNSQTTKLMTRVVYRRDIACACLKHNLAKSLLSLEDKRPSRQTTAAAGASAGKLQACYTCCSVESTRLAALLCC